MLRVPQCDLHLHPVGEMLTFPFGIGRIARGSCGAAALGHPNHVKQWLDNGQAPAMTGVFTHQPPTGKPRCYFCSHVLSIEKFPKYFFDTSPTPPKLTDPEWVSTMGGGLKKRHPSIFPFEKALFFFFANFHIDAAIFFLDPAPRGQVGPRRRGTTGRCCSLGRLFGWG